MSTGYALLDRSNPTGPNYYTRRNRPMLVYVVHITAGLQDFDTVDDNSAEGVVAYAQTTTRDVSWHVSTDSDSTIQLLPPEYTAWHVTNYNSGGYGHEISKLNTDWRVGPNAPLAWRAKTLDQAARHAAKIAVQYRIPIRWATRSEVDREFAKGSAGAPVGFIGHWELDPTRRDDPGRLPGTSTDTFPRDEFLSLVRYHAARIQTPPIPAMAGGMDLPMQQIPLLGTTGGGGQMTLPFAVGENSAVTARAWLSLAADRGGQFEVWFQGKSPFSSGVQNLVADGRWVREIPSGTESIVVHYSAQGSMGLMLEFARK